VAPRVGVLWRHGEVLWKSVVATIIRRAMTDPISEVSAMADGATSRRRDRSFVQKPVGENWLAVGTSPSRAFCVCARGMGASISPVLCKAGYMDLEVSPALTIPASELGWRFSRSSGPGGQHVNTSDSRVELSWNVGNSAALSDDQRLMLVTRLGRRLVGGVITVTVSERRSQLRNREIALAKLSDLVAEGLAPEAARRRATKPTRGSNRRRLAAKQQRAETKQQRKRPSAE
jgi:ribosome-associated protein